MKKILIAILMAWPSIAWATPETDSLRSEIRSLKEDFKYLKRSNDVVLSEKTQELKGEFDDLEDDLKGKLNWLLILVSVIGPAGLGLIIMSFTSMRKARKTTIPNMVKASTEKSEKLIQASELELKEELMAVKLQLGEGLDATRSDIAEQVAAAKTTLAIAAKQDISGKVEEMVTKLIHKERSTFLEMISLHKLEAQIKMGTKLLLIYNDEHVGEDEEGMRLLKEIYGFENIQVYKFYDSIPDEAFYRENEINAVVFYDALQTLEVDRMERYMQEIRLDFLASHSEQEIVDIPFTFLVYTSRSKLDFMDDYRDVANAANSKYTLYARLMESIRYQHYIKEYATSSPG